MYFMPLHCELTISIRQTSGKSRDGGKPAAVKLRKPVKTNTKRAAFLRWHLEDSTGRTIGATMHEFGFSRQNVFTYWTTIHREHGVGYALSANTITAILPRKCNSDSVFKPEF